MKRNFLFPQKELVLIGCVQYIYDILEILCKIIMCKTNMCVLLAKTVCMETTVFYIHVVDTHSSSITSITSLYNLWGAINLSSEEILSESFIVFAEDISNVKAFFLEVWTWRNFRSQNTNFYIFQPKFNTYNVLTPCRLINLQLQDWWTFHQIPNIQLQHSEVFDRFLQFFQIIHQSLSIFSSCIAYLVWLFSHFPKQNLKHSWNHP